MAGLRREKSKKEKGRIIGRWRGALKKWENSITQKSSGQRVFSYDVYRFSARQLLLYIAVGIVFCALAAYVFYRSLVVFAVFLPAGLFYPLLKREELKKQRLEKLNIEFKDAIIVLSSFLSAGYSVENAFTSSVKELEVLYGKEGMMTGEFARMESLIRMNRPVEQVMTDFADRSGLEDVRNFAEVFAAAKRTGGDLVSIISHTAGIIRDKIQVREEIKTLTASRRFEQKIMNLIPFLIVIYIDTTSSGFFDMMYQTALGKIMMTVCLGIYLVSVVLAERILKIEV